MSSNNNLHARESGGVGFSRIELQATAQQILGRQLRKARIDAGYRQKELALQLGRLTPYISGVECGIDEIDPATQWLWLSACGIQAVPPDKLPVNANPQPFTPPLGTDLREIRRNACYTQEELATKLHCSASYVCQVERGKCPVSESICRRWLRACGLPADTTL